MTQQFTANARRILTSSPARALVAFAATVIALFPLTQALAPGPGFAQAVIVSLVLCATGVIARWMSMRMRPVARAILTHLTQLVVLAILITRHVVPFSAVFGILPSGETVRILTAETSEALRQVEHGSAPMPQTEEFLVLLLLGSGLLHVVLFTLTVAARLPLISGTIVAAVGAAPLIIIADQPSTFWVIAAAIVILIMVWQCVEASQTPSVRGFWSTTTIAVLATVTAVFATTFVAPAANLPGSSGGPILNATLNLGADLRRPNPVTALTFTTDEPTMPYVRIATLSSYDGAIWYPDERPGRPLDTSVPIVAEAARAETIGISEIEIVDARGSRLPVPYPALSVHGLAGDWLMDRANGTVYGDDISGQRYRVTYRTDRPNIDSLRATNASSADADPEYRELPQDLTPLVGELAQAITAHADTDVDRLLTMERWFREEFTYSLEAPVAGDFDGTGIDAVAAFLEERSGYCTHFASAFTLMARSLGMPARIVVGYLPSRDTTREDHATVFTVSSDRLHAWPEIYMDGYGWIPFEPTASLGSATEFGGLIEAPEIPDAAELPADDADEATAPDDPELEDTDPEVVESEESKESTVPTDAAGTGSLLAVLIPLGILCLVLLPATVRLVQRRRRLRRAEAGDALAAWEEFRATVQDLGVPVPDTETARMLAVRVQEWSGVDGKTLFDLVHAVERAAYGGSEIAPDNSAVVVRLVRELRRELILGSSVSQRVAAWLTPRSLL